MEKDLKHRSSKFDSIISAATPLATLIARGYTPEQIKAEVIESLAPYFENKHILEESALLLIPECVSLYRIQRDVQRLKMFEKCLSTFQAAKAKNSEASLKSLATWQNQIDAGLSKFWSMHRLEVDKSTLEIEEVLHECLRVIGEITEGVARPYLKCLLHEALIAKGTHAEASRIDRFDLGEVVERLILLDDWADLLAPAPWQIRINKWRNVAYHHSARVESNLIICKLGTKPRAKEVELSRLDLLDVMRKIVNVYETIRLAHTIFFLDNLSEVVALRPPADVRIEAKAMTLATCLASQGFVVERLTADAEKAVLVVRDALESSLPQDIPIRGIHATQFVFLLWVITGARFLVVEYHEKDGTPSLRASCPSELCEKIDSGEMTFATLATDIGLKDLSQQADPSP